MLQILCLVFSRRAFDADGRAGSTAPVGAAIEHLGHEWSQMPLRRVRVDELAARAGVSRSYLSRLFRAEFGIAPGEATECLRCSRAESLLARTDLAISSIAEPCGFAYLYHFSHRFSRRYGASPREYRADDPGTSVLDHDGVRRLAAAVWE